MKQLIALLLFSSFLSCTKIEKPINETQPLNISMNFLELEEGQIFRYVFLTAVGYSDEDYFDFQYTGDTLILEVMMKEENEIMIKECISDGSNMFSSEEDYYWKEKDSVYINTWLIENDSLKFPPNSWSHLLATSDLALKIDLSCEVDIKGWKTSFPTVGGDKHLFTTDYTLNDLTYDTLGVFLKNEPLSFEGDGSTILYNKKHGIVRTSTYTAWTDDGQGWDRIK